MPAFRLFCSPNTVCDNPLNGRTKFAPTGVRGNVSLCCRDRRPDGPFVKQHLICCTCGAVALCMPSLVREGGPRQRWMSSPVVKLLYIRNYSSVSLTAATFPDKGRLWLPAFRLFFAPNTVCDNPLDGRPMVAPTGWCEPLVFAPNTDCDDRLVGCAVSRVVPL